MIIFKKLGLKDSMSIGLMTLSLADFLVCLLGLVRVALFIWKMVLPNGRIDQQSVSNVSVGWWRDVLFLCSSWIMAFLSVERCVCVVFPFKVKTIFTKFRSIVVIAVIFVVTIVIHMPVFLTQWLEWTTVQVTSLNGTIHLKDRLVIKYSKNRPQIQLYINIANGTVLPVPCQIVVFISVIWMIYGLAMSSRIRSSTSGKEDSDSKKQFNLTIKERRLVKVVVSLAIILTLCNIPRFIAIYAKQIFPNVDLRGTDINVFVLLWNIPFLASSINSSCNICVYLIVNKSYRQTFMEVLRRK